MKLPVLRPEPRHRTSPPVPSPAAAGLPVEGVLLAASLYWALAANPLFLAAVLKTHEPGQAATWGLGLALVVMLTALHYLLLALVCTHHTVKPVLTVLLLGTALATWFMRSYGVYLDPTMLRNVLRTDVAEASELFSWALLQHLLLYALLPLALLWRVPLRPQRLARALAWRLGSAGLAVALLLGTLLLVYQPLASTMRNHKELRYLITPANVLWSLGAVATAQARGAASPRQPIGLDALPGPAMASRQRPLLVVLVLGETARAANWGLTGYSRQTTPGLAALAARSGQPGAGTLVNFSDVTACGTNTETSVPCLFAPVGRRDYDEARIRGSESLLHVVARAGVDVHWRDNQSGCKGVCDGLPQDHVASLQPAGLCSDGRCLDEGLLLGLDERIAGLTRRAPPGAPKATQLQVLHMLGNHGPSYFRRYPAAFAKMQPECHSDDLQACSRQEIVNAYDNALLYTDHVLTRLVARLQAAAGEVDSVVLYVSDHGESLGEHGLFLHGLPYAVAPDVQTKVPMTMWLSDGALASLQLDAGCLQGLGRQPQAHDQVFHTLLGLLDVQTGLHEAALDLTRACRRGAGAWVAGR